MIAQQCYLCTSSVAWLPSLPATYQPTQAVAWHLVTCSLLEKGNVRSVAQRCPSWQKLFQCSNLPIQPLTQAYYPIMSFQQSTGVLVKVQPTQWFGAWLTTLNCCSTVLILVSIEYMSVCLSVCLCYCPIEYPILVDIIESSELFWFAC